MKIFHTLLLSLFFTFLFSQNDFFIKVKNTEDIDLSFLSSTKNINHPLASFISNFGIDTIFSPFNTKDINLQNTYVFEVSQDVTLNELINFTEAYEFIEYIEKVPEYELFYTPNDPLYSQQYALDIIDAQLAWDISSCLGNSNVVLAITDDAVRVDHEDIVSSLWNNPNEIPNNGIDDDSNGYIDDIVGWDASDNDNDPSPPANATNSYFSHGTHVAGIAGATTDNSTGIASSSFGVQIMPVKIAANSSGSLTGAYLGVDYAISCGYVDVVNMSWGGGSYSLTYQNLFNAGHNLGITFVAAAGNSNTSAPMYPAAYNYVISVAASNQNDVRASFSNYGTTIDVTAPGVNILSTVAGANNAYDFKSGTSMASPLVAGLCGLMKCYNNGITPDEIETCLKNTADDIYNVNPSYQNQLGAGRINALAAINCLSTAPTALFTTEDTIVCSNQPIQFNDNSVGASPLSWNWQFPGGTPASSILQNPVVSYSSNGTYNVTLTVTNAFGNDVITKNNHIKVQDPTATISGNATIQSGGAAFLKVDFTGTTPYDITYTDGVNNLNITGITQNPFYIQVNPTQTTSYDLLSMNDAFCSGLVSGSAEVNIANIANDSCSNLFQKYFNDNGATERINVEYTSDGGYIVTGATTAYGQGSYDVFATKFDVDDNLIWSNTYGTAGSGFNTGNELSYSTNVIEMDNGDFVFGCESNTYGTRSNVGMIVVFRTDASGNIIWQKTIGLEQDYSHVAKMMKDGNDILLVGSAGGSLTSGGLDDAYILKIDGNGNELFSNVLIAGSNDHFLDVLKIGNTYYCSGSSLSFSNTRTPFIATFDLNGTLLWSKYYSGLSHKLDVKFIYLNNELTILSGNNSNTFNFFKIDLQGNVIGQGKNFSTNSGSDLNFALEIESLSSNSFMVSGYTETQNSNDLDLFASKIDLNFNESWTKLFGESGDESAYFRDNNLSLDLSNNTGLITGYTAGYGNIDKDLYLAKFSLDTTIDCESIFSDYFNETPVNVFANNYTWTVEQLPSLINANFIRATMPLSETLLCESLCDTTPIINPIFCENSSIDTNICLGDSLQLNVRSGNNYNWEPNYNISNTQIQNPIVWPELDTTYIVYYEDDSCQYFDTIHVSVSSVYVEASPDDTVIICTVDDLQLNAIGADSYTWTPIAGLNNANIANPIFSGNFSEELIVTGQNQFGCVDNDTVFVEVLPCCGAYADFKANDTTICIGDSIFFTNLSVSGNNPSYTWNFGNNATPNSFNGVNPNWISFANPGSFEIELILTDDCGFDTAKLNIYVNDLPPTNIADDTIVCGVDSFIYELGDVEIVGNDYIWSPSMGLDNSNISNPIATVTDSVTYSVTVVDQFTGCVNNDSVKIKVIQEPDTILQLLQTSFCIEDSATIFIDLPNVDSVVWQNQIRNIDTFQLQVLRDTLIFANIYIDNCMFMDSVRINADSIPVRSLTYQDTVCINTWDTVLVQTLGIPVWENNDTSFQNPFFVSQDTTLYLTTYNGACSIEDTMQVYARALPEDSIEGQDSVCIGGTVNLNTSGLYNYEWSNGSIYDSASYDIQTDSTIYVTFEDAYCTNTDTFYINVVDTPQINITGVTDYCQGDLVALSVNSADSLYWENGNIGNNFSDIANISDSVILVNQFNRYCGVISDSVMLNIDTIPTRSFLYNDTVCQGDNDTIFINSSGVTVTENNDTINQLEFVVNTDTTIILQTQNGSCSIFDSIYIFVRELPYLNIIGNDTTCVNSIETFSLPAGYEYLWSNGDTSNSTDYEINNDTIVYVSFSNENCSNSYAFNVYAVDTPQVIIQGDSAYCEGEVINLNINTLDSIWWSLGTSENPLIDTATFSETVTATLFNNYCGNYTSSINLDVDTFPEIEIVSPIEMFENEEMQIEVYGDAMEWTWRPPYGLSCINCREPVTNADTSLTYVLETSNNNCLSYDTLEVKILNLENCLLIPTAFSPNNDNNNDNFKAIILDERTEVNSFKIYNRWGELLHDSLEPWDGTFKNNAQNIGVYIYVLTYSCDGEDKILTGNVTLIR